MKTQIVVNDITAGQVVEIISDDGYVFMDGFVEWVETSLSPDGNSMSFNIVVSKCDADSATALGRRMTKLWRAQRGL